MDSTNRYELCNDEGILHTVEVAYNLCDNGYHKWSTMMEPSKHPNGIDDRNWTEMLESLRKDVKCLFGELKQEDSILKYGNRFSDLALTDNIFLTCCAIHNQRKVLAGLNEMWNLDTINLKYNSSSRPEFAEVDDDLSQETTAIFRRLQEYERLEGVPELDNSGLGGGENLILPFDDNAIEEHNM
jgi:Plant transposon protein